VDEQVLSALARGARREALLLCAEAYGAAIGRLCMAMLRSQSEAEDVAQDTLLTAYQKLDVYRAEASLRAWLCGIARKKCLKQLESRRRREQKLVLLQGGDASPTAEEDLHVRRRAARAWAALEEVRPTEREALLLRYECELDYQGVAEACAIDEAAARKRVSRGLARLRELLGPKTATEAS
jgi:RNA polymerase sigma-70 factor (ECF subfamily)